MPPHTVHEASEANVQAVLAIQERDGGRLADTQPPAQSQQEEIVGHRAKAAVLAVVTSTDRPAARRAVSALREDRPGLVVATGGASGGSLATGVHELPHQIGDAARELDELLHA